MPNVKYFEGPLLSNVEVVLVLVRVQTVDAAGQTRTYDERQIAPNTICQAQRFLSDFVQSSYLNLLSEYSTPLHPIGHGTLKAVRDLDLPRVVPEEKKVVDDFADLVPLVLTAIAAGSQQPDSSQSLPPNTPNTCYVVVVPDPFEVTMVGNPRTGSGWHFGYNLQDQTLFSCAIILGSACSPTLLAHELLEAITDPEVGKGWHDTLTTKIGRSEICDLCESEGSVIFHGDESPLFWSQREMKCIAPYGEALLGLGTTRPLVEIHANGMVTCMGGILFSSQVTFSVTARLNGQPYDIVSYRWLALIPSLLPWVFPSEILAQGTDPSIVAGPHVPGREVDVTVHIKGVDGCEWTAEGSFSFIDDQQYGMQLFMCDRVLQTWWQTTHSRHPEPTPRGDPPPRVRSVAASDVRRRLAQMREFQQQLSGLLENRVQGRST